MASRIWTALSLFAIVLQLTLIQGFDFRHILLFVLPVLFALSIASQTSVTRSTILARTFLSLIGFGLLIAEIPWLFPKLGGIDPNLPPQSDRVLAWYAVIYLVYMTIVLPTHAFTDDLYQHKVGGPTKFSRFTCWLGLFTSLVIGAGVVAVAVTFIQLLPIL